MSILFTGRRFFQTTVTPAPAVLFAAGRFPSIVSSDSVPPTQPGTPVGTAVSTSQINWTWTVSTDSGGSGLSGYRVYLDGSASPITTVTTNSYSSTGHSSGTTHTLRVEAFDGAGNSTSSGTGSQTTQSSSSPGVTVEPGFSVSAPGGLSHGQPLYITRTDGRTWAPRTYSKYPWLYDLVSAQYKDGVALNIHSGRTDGASIQAGADACWSAYNANAGAASVKYSTSRPMRHPRVTATYLQDVVNAAMKLMLGPPVWPASWNGGVQNNARLYISWWAHDKFAYNTPAGAYQHKLSRYNSTTLQGVGSCEFNGDSFQFNGTKYSQPGSADYWVKPSNGQYVRYEMYLDRINGFAEGYCQFRYQRGGASSFAASGFPNGEFEYRPAAAALYDANPNNIPFLPGWSNITATVGYDGNTNTHTLQEIEEGELYFDTERERFEVTNSPVWDVSPAAPGNLVAGIPREIQGVWSRETNEDAIVYVNQGAFPSLSGLYLWYVDGFKTATRVLRFN